MIKTIWQIFLRYIGYSYTICEVRDGDVIATLRSDGWVIITDGYSTDAMPIDLVSQELVDSFEKILQEKETK